MSLDYELPVVQVRALSVSCFKGCNKLTSVLCKKSPSCCQSCSGCAAQACLQDDCAAHVMDQHCCNGHAASVSMLWLRRLHQLHSALRLNTQQPGAGTERALCAACRQLRIPSVSHTASPRL